MTNAELSTSDYAVIESKFLRILQQTIRAPKPQNAPNDWDRLRDLENICALMIDNAEDFQP